METRSKFMLTTRARENAAPCRHWPFSFLSYWLRRWCEWFQTNHSAMLSFLERKSNLNQIHHSFVNSRPRKAEKLSFVSTGPFGERFPKESRISAVYDNLSTGHLVLWRIMKRKPVVIKIQENEMKALARGFLESIVVTRSVTPL